jgi:hypothetical protein
LEPVIEYVNNLRRRRRPGDFITVLIPEFETRRWRHRLLHNQTCWFLSTYFIFRQGSGHWNLPPGGSRSPEKTLEYELSLGAELELKIHYPVDVKVLNHAPVPLCHSASGGEVIFSRNEELRYEWVEKTWDMYLDMQYFLWNNLLDAEPRFVTPAKKSLFNQQII